jgi:REP element-mobilizing transposase RayT
MSSYRQHLYHIVFRTKDSKPTIKPENSGDLYAYITGITKNIHILTDMNPSIAPVDFVKDIKVSSSKWIKGSGLFPEFHGWSDGYGSFTCSYKDREYLIDYINNQREHHRKKTFEEEFRMLLNEYGIRIDERFFP